MYQDRKVLRKKPYMVLNTAKARTSELNRTHLRVSKLKAAKVRTSELNRTHLRVSKIKAAEIRTLVINAIK